MRIALASLASLALALGAGCGGEDATPREDPPPPPPTETAEPPANEEGPPGDPPATEEGGPPPAWIETADASAWMAYGSYCWDGICFDILQATCDDDAVPRLDVRRGETVRFHLGYEPATAELTVSANGGPAGRPDIVPLDPARTLEWQAERDGHLWLSVPASDDRTAAYQACLSLAS